MKLYYEPNTGEVFYAVYSKDEYIRAEGAGRGGGRQERYGLSNKYA